MINMELTIENATGYKCITTFGTDFAIANYFGEQAVRNTFERSKDWLDDYKYWTELVMILNWWIWTLYETNEKLARVYNELWETAEQMFIERYENDSTATSYYYKTLD